MVRSRPLAPGGSMPRQAAMASAAFSAWPSEKPRVWMAWANALRDRPLRSMRPVSGATVTVSAWPSSTSRRGGGMSASPCVSRASSAIQVAAAARWSCPAAMEATRASLRADRPLPMTTRPTAVAMASRNRTSSRA
ncbi:hypothetical protein AZA_90540 [Nitrospirillum viridazoti Y2]|nr:hypothetical protein AZA_90540 [Nitrospirillum amazonense Y2]